jgi:hypothetical protein
LEAVIHINICFTELIGENTNGVSYRNPWIPAHGTGCNRHNTHVSVEQFYAIILLSFIVILFAVSW